MRVAAVPVSQQPQPNCRSSIASHSETVTEPFDQEPFSPLQVIIREIEALADGSFRVNVEGIGLHATSFPVVVKSPFVNREQESELNWYCEVADREPFSISSRLQKVEEALDEYGTRLFNMLFPESSTKLPEDTPLSIRVTGSYRFCSLHWELLKDPERGPVALDESRCIVRDVRMRTDRPRIRVPHRILSYPTLNVLFLTARQRFGEGDIPLRVESLAVMDVVKDHDLPLQFDLVRPGTLTALEEKLEQRRPGFYHILHLDCHGASAQDGCGGQYAHEANRLLLETERGSHTTVDAEQIARLVDKYQVPIVFTSACRSGKTNIGAPSFAYDLFSRSKLQCALVMALSVLVDTSARFVREFYLAMLDDEGSMSVNGATRIARRAMWRDRLRKGVLGTIERQDWWIPQLFERDANGQECEGVFKRCTWEEAASKLPSPDDKALIWEENQRYTMRKTLLIYDSVDRKKFVGRDEDLRMLECKVFSHDRSDSVILLYGMMGNGKTAFMTYVSWWWCITGLVHDKFVFRFHEQQFTLNDMVWHIYRQLFNVVNYNPADASERQIREDRMRVTEHLRKYCYVIVIDSAERLCAPLENRSGHRRLETVSPPCESDSDMESEDDGVELKSHARDLVREELAKWLAELQGGRTVVLVGSRGSSESLLMKYIANKSNDLDLAAILGKYPKHHIDLLRPEWSKALVKQIVDIDEDNCDPKYEALYSYPMLDLYAGNPLVINLVVGSFRAGDAAKIPHAEELFEKLQNSVEIPSTPIDVMASLEYSFNLLSPSQQEALLFLAPFKSSVTSQGLSHYADELERSSPSVPRFDRDSWESAIQMAVRWGLLTVHERVKRQRGQQAWRIHVCLSLLLMNKLCQKLASSTSCGVKAAHNYEKSLSNHEKEALLRPMLHAMHVAYWRWALQLYDLLRDFDKERHDAGRVMTEIDFWNLKRLLKFALDEKIAFYGILLPIYWFLATRNDIPQRYILCKRIVEKTGTFESLSDIPSSHQVYCMDVPRMYHIFGMLLGHHRLQKLDEAEAWYNRTKKIWESCNCRQELAVTEHELGWIAMNKRDFTKAKAHYDKAVELSDRLDRSRTLHNMGLLASFESDFESARKYHEQARRLYEEQGDERAVASAYHHLAIVTAKADNYTEADAFAKKALATRKQREETEETANVYQLRGNIALRRASAERDCEESLKYLKMAKKKYDKAMLTYNCQSGFYYGVIPKREMLHENYGLLMAIQRRFVSDEEDKKALLRTEMDSYTRVKDGPYPKALYNLGLLHEELGQAEEAYKCYDTASRFVPECTRDNLDKESCLSAMAAKARCLATGQGVVLNEHEALTEMLRSREEIDKDDPFEALQLPIGDF